MKAVILAAGRGTRMGALTDALPKPLLEIGEKTLLEHKFDILPDALDELLIVIGHHGEKIRERFGEAYGARPITYVTQETLNGTGGALWEARAYLTERFLVMMGDDLYAREDAERCLAVPDWAVLVSNTVKTSAGGRVVLEGDRVVAIEEGSNVRPGLVNTNMLALDPRVFEHHLVPKEEGSDEYGLPQTVLRASLDGAIPLTAILTDSWVQVTSPEDLAVSLD